MSSRAGTQPASSAAGRARARDAPRDEFGRFLARTMIVILAAALPVALSACESEKPKTPSTLLEVIRVAGTCHEDHVDQSDGYAGEIVRWRNDDTKVVSTYGHVISTTGMGKRAIESAQHPTKYQAPFIVEFRGIQIDTNQPKWTIHGVSLGREVGSDGEIEQGYDTTCELAVIKRGKEFDSVGAPHSTPNAPP